MIETHDNSRENQRIVENVSLYCPSQAFSRQTSNSGKRSLKEDYTELPRQWTSQINRFILIESIMEHARKGNAHRSSWKMRSKNNSHP
jgi:hypothetical protein